MIQALLQQLQKGEAKFTDVIAFIDAHYTFTPTAFHNGEQYNDSDQNQGSCKVFSIAQLHGLSKEQTLLLFAEHFDAVLTDSLGTNHQNIRQFMVNGWEGITFKGTALALK